MLHRITDQRTGRTVIRPRQALLGGFTIERLLGAGGFGAVYAANGPGGVCAIKEFRPHANWTMEVLRDRYAMEAHILQAFYRHPCIPGFRARFQYEETFFLAEEMIPGVTLGALLRQSQAGAPAYSLGEGLVWLWVITRTIDHLHQRLILYQDLKPSNIMVRPDRTPVLVDYGAARHYAGIAANRRLLFGSKGYIAPEILINPDRQMDYRSDIYSLGCLSYTLLTGYKLAPEQILGRQAIEVPSRLLLQFHPEAAQLPQAWLETIDNLLRQSLVPNPLRRLADLKLYQQRISSLLSGLKLPPALSEMLTRFSGELKKHDIEARAEQAAHNDELETEPANVRWEPSNLVFAPLDAHGETTSMPLSVYTISGKVLQGTPSCVSEGLECVEKSFQGTNFRLLVRAHPRLVSPLNKWVRDFIILRTPRMPPLRIPVWMFVARPGSPYLTGQEPLPPREA